MRMDPEQFLLAEIGRRDETDSRISWGTAFGWSLLSLGAYAVYITYKMVDRRVVHVRRRLAVSTSLWHTLAARADASSDRPAVQEGLDNLSRIHAQIEAYERKNRRNAQAIATIRAVAFLGAWAGFALFTSRYDPDVPLATQESIVTLGSFVFDVSMIAMLVVAAVTNSMLSRDARFLDVWEGSWSENVDWVMRRLGMSAASPARPAAGERSTAVSVLLCLVTFGLWAIVWRRRVVGEWNRHFDADDRVEDSILVALGLLAPSPAAVAHSEPPAPEPGEPPAPEPDEPAGE